MYGPEHMDAGRAARVLGERAHVLGPIVGALAAACAYDAIVIPGRPSMRPIDTLGA
jgi:hypothetical protein